MNEAISSPQWGQVDIESPETANGEHLWKYLSLHKLLDFLYTGQLHFTRLDAFDDPIEGVTAWQLGQREKVKDWAISVDGFNPNIPLNMRRNMVLEKKVSDAVYIEEVKKSQKCQFINCWFHGDRESMAMWDLYAGRDSVAVKVKAEDLIVQTKLSAEGLVKECGNRICFIGGPVKYYKLNPFDQRAKRPPIKYAMMKKDEAYKHESEFRFGISALLNWLEDDPKEFFRLELSTVNLEVELICHPMMEHWKTENVKRLVASLRPNFKVSRSAIQLRVRG